MNKIFLISTLLLLTSCIRKKSQPVSIPEKFAVTHLSRGPFVVDQKVYFSDGNKSYCQFKNIEEAIEIFKKVLKDTSFSPFPSKTEPVDMKLVGSCSETLLKG